MRYYAVHTSYAVLFGVKYADFLHYGPHYAPHRTSECGQQEQRETWAVNASTNHNARVGRHCVAVTHSTGHSRPHTSLESVTKTTQTALVIT